MSESVNLYAGRTDISVSIPSFGVVSSASELPPRALLERVVGESSAVLSSLRRKPIAEQLSERSAAYSLELEEARRRALEAAESGTDGGLVGAYRRAAEGEAATRGRGAEESREVYRESKEVEEGRRRALRDAKTKLETLEREAARKRDVAAEARLRLDQAREAEHLESLRKQWCIERAADDPKLMERFMDAMAGVAPKAVDETAAAFAALQGGPPTRK